MTFGSWRTCPFIDRDITTQDESFVVIRFREPAKSDTDFTSLLSMIQGSIKALRNTLVVPGSKMGMAMEIIVGPIIESLPGSRVT